MLLVMIMKENLQNVTKPNGYIIDCMGEDDRKRANPDQEMLNSSSSFVIMLYL